MTDNPLITLRLDDARRLFDLATDSPLLCSGSFETDDVRVLRRLARAVGTDLAHATPDGFVRDFPHAFQPFDVNLERDTVATGQERFVSGIGRVPETRPETDEEVYARLGQHPDRCSAGGYRRQCQRPEAHPIHVDPNQPDVPIGEEWSA